MAEYHWKWVWSSVYGLYTTAVGIFYHFSLVLVWDALLSGQADFAP